MAKFGIGQSIRRVEDPRLLTGGGRYTDDTKLSAHAARAYVLRSPHAHADIRKIEATKPETAPAAAIAACANGSASAGRASSRDPAIMTPQSRPSTLIGTPTDERYCQSRATSANAPEAAL